MFIKLNMFSKVAIFLLIHEKSNAFGISFIQLIRRPNGVLAGGRKFDSHNW